VRCGVAPTQGACAALHDVHARGDAPADVNVTVDAIAGRDSCSSAVNVSDARVNVVTCTGRTSAMLTDRYSSRRPGPCQAALSPTRPSPTHVRSNVILPI
jgi:hypothetical protein